MAPPGHQARTTAILSLTFILERLDEQIITAVYTPLGAALHASPSQLGTLTLCRALVQVSNLSICKSRLNIASVEMKYPDHICPSWLHSLLLCCNYSRAGMCLTN